MTMIQWGGNFLSFCKIFNQTPQEIEGKEIASVFLRKIVLVIKKKKKVEKIEVEQRLKIIGIVEEEDVITYLNRKIIENKVSVESYSRLKVKCKNSDYLNQVRGALEQEAMWCHLFLILLTKPIKFLELFKSCWLSLE